MRLEILKSFENIASSVGSPCWGADIRVQHHYMIVAWCKCGCRKYMPQCEYIKWVWLCTMYDDAAEICRHSLHRCHL